MGGRHDEKISDVVLIARNALSTPAQSGEAVGYVRGVMGVSIIARNEDGLTAIIFSTDDEVLPVMLADEFVDELRSALSPGTSKVGAVDQTATAGWRRVVSLARYPSKTKEDMRIALSQIAAQADKELRRASPPPVEAGMVIAALSRRNGMMTSGSLARPNMTISFATLEECNEAYDAIRSAAPKDMEEGR